MKLVKCRMIIIPPAEANIGPFKGPAPRFYCSLTEVDLAMGLALHLELQINEVLTTRKCICGSE